MRANKRKVNLARCKERGLEKYKQKMKKRRKKGRGKGRRGGYRKGGENQESWDDEGSSFRD